MKTVKATKPGREPASVSCRFEGFSFGSIRIDGVTYEHDVTVDRGQIGKRKAIEELRRNPHDTNAILHVTC